MPQAQKEREIMDVQKDTIEKIRGYILERAGLYFREHEYKSLLEHLRGRMAALKVVDGEEYYKILTEEPTKYKEFTEFLNLLTNKHTHFFRNPSQFVALKETILPEMIERKLREGDMNISILSAGCSTGEEPYSIAMVVADLLGSASGWKISILAADISTEALVQAKKGIYDIRALQHVGKEFIKNYIEKYCLVHNDKIFVSPAVKKMVDFEYMNLVDENFPSGFDIIFCRHVTIYFETVTVRKIIEKFHSSLNHQGYLFSGGTETMFGVCDKFEPMEFKDAMVYKKGTPKKEEPKEVLRPPKPVLPVAPVIARPVIIERPAKTLKEAYELFDVSKKEAAKKDYVRAEKLLKESIEIEPALQEAHMLLANIFVNRDRDDDAEAECRKCIGLNSLSAEPYYLLGLIYKKRGEEREAIEQLKKAVYLNYNFSLAYYTLAGLYESAGDRREAIRAYENALRALEAENEEDFKAISSGLSKNLLAQACTRSIMQLSGGKNG